MKRMVLAALLLVVAGCGIDFSALDGRIGNIGNVEAEVFIRPGSQIPGRPGLGSDLDINQDSSPPIQLDDEP